MEVHLDLVGGMAGDMFIAALLDAFPDYEGHVVDAIDALGSTSRVRCALVPFRDHVLQGHRFQVALRSDTLRPMPFAAAAAAHGHVTWASIRARLETSRLPGGIRSHAIGIFQLLADAEAIVHGIDVDAVEFHEVGAWDSIADVVGAAALIVKLEATRWTASPAPLGRGLVDGAHGRLPIPAPATARLLIGMPTVDDGIGGERVTPTGAAILRYLCPPDCGESRKRVAPRVRTLVASGTGFGMRALPGISNHVRALCFAPGEPGDAGVPSIADQREIQILEFEVDDQSAEDLATGLDRLRAHAAVLDVTQTPTFGKKGRMMAHVRVLARQSLVDDVIEACFRETTTIGLRQHTVRGFGLRRAIEEVGVDGHRLRVKVVDRPGGRTAKTESDDVLRQADHARRADLRRRAEEAALDAAQASLDA